MNVGKGIPCKQQHSKYFLKLKEEAITKAYLSRIELKKMYICKYVCFRENIEVF